MNPATSMPPEQSSPDVPPGNRSTETPLISVIVPTYNRADMLGEALQTLIHQETGGEFRYEIVVVDNASTDATSEIVRRVAADSPTPVHYIYHDVPGDAPTRNCGLAASRGEWLAFFDDDQLAAPDWLLQLYRAALETGAPVIGGAVHLHLSRDVLDRLGPYVRRTSFRETEHCEKIRPFTGKQRPGCANSMVARRVFEAIGQFDAAMAWGGSDSDFFLRAQRAGMPMYFSPQAIILHRIPLNRLTPEYFRWDAQQGCDALACHDLKFHGPRRLILCCLARIGQGVAVLLPGLVWAELRQNRGEVLDYKVRLWRIEGYIRRAIALLAPKWFPQDRYFSDLKFRKGRTIGQHALNAEAVS